MTSEQSFNNNTSEAGGVLLEISEPDLIVLPIPERSSLANTSFRLRLDLTNHTLTSWKFNPDSIITPELVAADDRSLERKLTANEPEIYPRDNLVNTVVDFISNLIYSLQRKAPSSMSPKTARGISIPAKICWEGDSLQLKCSTHSSQALSYSFHFWVFEGLKLGNYQLKFSTESSIKTDKSLQVRKRKQIKGDRLTTSFVNLRLLELAKPNDKAIEVDGIHFQAIAPEAVWILPERKVETPVKIGIRITNNTQTNFTFGFYNSLIPELITQNWQIVEKFYSSNFLKSRLESDFLLAMPEKSVTFFPSAKLFWSPDERLMLKIAAGDGGYWIFNNLKAGRHRLRFTYKNKDAETIVYNENTKKRMSLEKLWRGMVLLPTVEFCLIKALV